jgi:hypothetical protein
MRFAASSLVLLVAISGTAGACEPPPLDASTRIEGTRHVVRFRGAPATPPLNMPFAMEIAVCARDGKPVAGPRVEAWMPAHRRGMNYKPSVTEKSPGTFRAEGLLLHMPGRWELIFEVGGERLTAAYTLD